MDAQHTHISRLLSSYLNGSASGEETQELFDWLKENNPESVEELENVIKKNYTESLQSPARISTQASERILQRLFESIDFLEEAPVRHIRFNRIKKWVAAAAILVIAGAGAYFIFNDKKKQDTGIVVTPIVPANDALPGGDHAVLTMPDGRQIRLDSTQGALIKQDQLTVTNKDGKLSYEGQSEDVQYHTLSTPKGGIYKIILPDNTEAWLNAASSIKYPTTFTGNTRLVEITGEVYFEVAKNTAQPFIVSHNEVSVYVTGTHFNVNAYEDEGSARITLLEGGVRVGLTPSAFGGEGSDRSVFLKPGEQAIVKVSPLGGDLEGASPLAISYSPDIEEVMAWKNGLFKFNGADIETVMRQVERWYDLEVVFEGPKPSGHFEGEIPRNVNASQMLKVIAISGVHYRIEGKKMIVTK